ncbi:IS701 family transposase [Streptomyces purpurogeneiscleroticus]|uniref:IS701 family transposase n=1 Tax=Streptomyces purpurogeneiscleroticus TaxID=68259 RepID=UPI001CC10DEA|nr:transposase [Streptomyces purpurogeneiscleroticus]
MHDAKDLLTEVSSEVFASLPRSDQRRTAEQLLRGMATTPGRKTARNIALRLSDPPAEQRFQHFIAKARWDWEPVRAALATAVERHAPATAYVAHPLVLSKTGNGSAGVHTRFVPELGQTINGQFAYGLWHTTGTLATPVDWHLELPDEWLQDPQRRRQVDIPERYVRDLNPGLPALSSALTDLVDGLFGSTRPLVIDARHLPVAALLGRFARARLPWLAQISDALTVVPATRSRHGADRVPVHQLLWRIRQMRRPVDLSAPWRTAAMVRVRLPGAPLPGAGAEPEPLTLLAEWDEPEARPRRCWLTDLPGSAADLLSLTTLLDGAAGRTSGADGAGLRDYSGRSFTGWHRHMTMVSVTHAVHVLTAHEAPPERSAQHRVPSPAAQQPRILTG